MGRHVGTASMRLLAEEPDCIQAAVEHVGKKGGRQAIPVRRSGNGGSQYRGRKERRNSSAWPTPTRAGWCGVALLSLLPSAGYFGPKNSCYVEE